MCFGPPIQLSLQVVDEQARAGPDALGNLGDHAIRLTKQDQQQMSRLNLAVIVLSSQVLSTHNGFLCFLRVPVDIHTQSPMVTSW